MQDTRHTLFDNFGCGPNRRAVLAKQMESGEHTFCDVSNELYASLSVPVITKTMGKGERCVHVGCICPDAEWNGDYTK
jgi:hypothetical protein